MKHTKGEWGIADNHIKGNHYQYTVLANMSAVVCDVMRHNFMKVGKDKFKSKDKLHPCKEAEANAKLIAAAPELLEAVKVALWDLEHGEAEAQKQGKPRLTERAEIFRNAIQKATT